MSEACTAWPSTYEFRFVAKTSNKITGHDDDMFISDCFCFVLKVYTPSCDPQLISKEEYIKEK